LASGLAGPLSGCLLRLLSAIVYDIITICDAIIDSITAPDTSLAHVLIFISGLRAFASGSGAPRANATDPGPVVQQFYHAHGVRSQAALLQVLSHPTRAVRTAAGMSTIGSHAGKHGCCVVQRMCAREAAAVKRLCSWSRRSGGCRSAANVRALQVMSFALAGRRLRSILPC
jgi:hypothetical protein